MKEEKSFLREYAKLSNHTEIPGIFTVWSGIAGLSCALGRRCWIDMGHYIIYPNLYVLLVASSGKCRKSAAIDIIERLLRQLEPKPNLISQKITPEALIESLKVVQINDNKIFLKESCVGFVIADELNTFLNIKAYEGGLGSLLTTLFDCKSHFSYHTRGKGIEVLSDSCLGLLGGTTIEWLKASMPTDAIGGGLTSRIIFVYCATKTEPVAITRRTKEQGQVEEFITKRLQLAMTLEGEIKLSQEAWNYFEEGYNDFYRNSLLYEIPSLAGYASRRHVHLLKIATIFAVSNRTDLSIEIEDIKSADKILSMSEQSMPMLLSIITASEMGLLIQEVFRYIKRAGKIPRKKLLAKVVNKMDSKTFSTICETLIQSGQVSASFTGTDLEFTAI